MGPQGGDLLSGLPSDLLWGRAAWLDPELGLLASVQSPKLGRAGPQRGLCVAWSLVGGGRDGARPEVWSLVRGLNGVRGQATEYPSAA